MAAMRASADKSSNSPASTSAKDVANSTDSPAPTRRATTRARKVPSRLLPSPSPPPSRPSPYSNLSKSGKGGKDAAAASPSTPSASGAATKLRKASRLNLQRSTPNPLAPRVESADDDTSTQESGLGKRKRRPSSMYMPPSTLTSSDTAITPGSSSVRTKKKSFSPGPDREDVKKTSPHGSASVNSQNGGVKGRGRLSRGGLDRKSLLPAVLEQGAYDSDGGMDAPTFADSDLEMENLDASLSEKRRRLLHGRSSLSIGTQDFELSPPPLLPRSGSARIQIPAELTQPTFTKGGQVSASPEAASKRNKFGLRGFDGNVNDAWRVFGSGRQDRRNRREAAADSSPQHPWRSVGAYSLSAANALANTPSKSRGEPQRLGLGPFNVGIAKLWNAEQSGFDADSEQEDDEEDFHQAMLDGDFDFFDSQKPEVVGPQAWATAGVRKEDEDDDDTPATTPRSPQSGCDLPTPGSPSSKSAESSASTIAAAVTVPMSGIHDTVFAHALPTTLVGADRPHQHAGSLTLSLPYSPKVGLVSPRLGLGDDQDMEDGTGTGKGAKDSFATPILERRVHQAIGGSKPEGLPISLKFGPATEDRVTSAAQFLQLSPGIEMDSPLLSPSLGLDLADKVSQPPSPFAMGVSSLPALDSPAPLALTPAQSAANPSVASFTLTAVSVPAEEANKPQGAAAKRTIQNHPPPRHISFTVRDVHSTPVGSSLTQSSLSGLQASTSSTTPPPRSLPPMDRTPELVYRSGSTSSEASFESASPISRSDSDMAADAEVENLLFGPPEKLDLRELDQVWGGSASQENKTQVAKPQSTVLTSATSLPTAGAAPLRRAKVTRLHYVDLTPN